MIFRNIVFMAFIMLIPSFLMAADHLAPNSEIIGVSENLKDELRLYGEIPPISRKAKIELLKARLFNVQRWAQWHELHNELKKIGGSLDIEDYKQKPPWSPFVGREIAGIISNVVENYNTSLGGRGRILSILHEGGSLDDLMEGSDLDRPHILYAGNISDLEKKAFNSQLIKALEISKHLRLNAGEMPEWHSEKSKDMKKYNFLYPVKINKIGHISFWDDWSVENNFISWVEENENDYKKDNEWKHRARKYLRSLLNKSSIENASELFLLERVHYAWLNHVTMNIADTELRGLMDLVDRGFLSFDPTLRVPDKEGNMRMITRLSGSDPMIYLWGAESGQFFVNIRICKTAVEQALVPEGFETLGTQKDFGNEAVFFKNLGDKFRKFLEGVDENVLLSEAQKDTLNSLIMEMLGHIRNNTKNLMLKTLWNTLSEMPDNSRRWIDFDLPNRIGCMVTILSMMSGSDRETELKFNKEMITDLKSRVYIFDLISSLLSVLGQYEVRDLIQAGFIFQNKWGRWSFRILEILDNSDERFFISLPQPFSVGSDKLKASA